MFSRPAIDVKSRFILIFLLISNLSALYSQKYEVLINKGHSDFVTSISESASKDYLLTSSYDGKIIVWDSRLKAEMFYLKIPEIAVTKALFASNDSVIVATSFNAIYVFDFFSRKLVASQNVSNGIATFSVSNNLLYYSTTFSEVWKTSVRDLAHSIKIFENYSRKSEFIINSNAQSEDEGYKRHFQQQAIRISNDGTYLFHVTGYSNKMVIYNLKDRHAEAKIVLHSEDTIAVKYSISVSDDELPSCFIGMGEEIMKLILKKNGKEIGVSRSFRKKIDSASILGIDYVSSLDKLAAVSVGNSKVYLFNRELNLDTAIDVKTQFQVQFLISIYYQKNTGHLLIGGQDGTFGKIDLSSYRYDWIAGQTNWPLGFSYSLDSSQLYVNRMGMFFEFRNPHSYFLNFAFDDNNYGGFIPISANRIIGLHNSGFDFMTLDSPFRSVSALRISIDELSENILPDIGSNNFSVSGKGNVYLFHPRDKMNRVFKLSSDTPLSMVSDSTWFHLMDNPEIFLSSWQKLKSIDASRNDSLLVVCDINNDIYLIQGEKIGKISPRIGNISMVKILRSGRHVVVFSETGIYLYDVENKDMTVLFRTNIKNKFMCFLEVSEDRVYLSDITGKLYAGSLNTKIPKLNIEYLHDFGITNFSLAPFNSGNKLVLGFLDNSVRIFDLQKKESILDCYPGLRSQVTSYYSENNLFILKDGTYFRPRVSEAAKVFLRTPEGVFPIEVFDIFFNRPDKILATMDSLRNQASINMYSSIIKKRLEVNHLIEKPSEKIVSDIPVIKILKGETGTKPIKSPKQSFEMEVSTQGSPIRKINVSINGVPVVLGGIKPKSNGVNKYTGSVQLELGYGENQIQFFAVNDAGVESLRLTVNLQYLSAKPIVNRYVIAMGVSNYADQRYYLKYPRKDGSDLLKVFRDKNKKIIVDSLYDEQFSIQGLQKLKERLLKTDINDEIIILYSGHGYINRDFDFCLATVKTDMGKTTGVDIMYNQIEEFLADLPARKKLLLIDACNSGLIEKPKNPGIENSNQKVPVDTVDISKGAIESKNSANNAHDYFDLMNELFSDLGNRLGLVVISASGGKENAYESNRWANGAFTYSVLKGLRDREADLNKDKKITVSELKEFVITEVLKVTGGRQRPTSRLENNSNDWIIWDQ